MSFDAFWELKARSLPVEEPEALARAVWDHCHSVLTPTETTEGLRAEIRLAQIEKRGLQAILCREGVSDDPNVEAVRDMLLTRSQAGVAKYGMTTNRPDIDLRGWLEHALEEGLDQCVYLRAAIRRLDALPADSNLATDEKPE